MFNVPSERMDVMNLTPSTREMGVKWSFSFFLNIYGHFGRIQNFLQIHYSNNCTYECMCEHYGTHHNFYWIISYPKIIDIDDLFNGFVLTYIHT